MMRNVLSCLLLSGCVGTVWLPSNSNSATLSTAAAERFTLTEFAGGGEGFTGITVDRRSGIIYAAGAKAAGTIFEVRRGSNGNLTTVEAKGQLQYTNDLFYPYLSTDIEFHNGAIYTQLAPEPGQLVKLEIGPGRSEAAPIEEFDVWSGIESGIAALGSRLFVTSGKANQGTSEGTTVSVFDLESLSVLNTIDVGFEPGSLEIDPLTKHAYVAPLSGGKMIRLNPGTGEFVETPVRSNGENYGDFAIDPTGKFIYQTGRGGGIFEVEIETGESTQFVRDISGDAQMTDLVFGPSTDASGGSSLFFTDASKIMEISGFPAVPEPSTLLLVALSGVSLLRRSREASR